jgi:hypothetical protein
MNVEGVTKIITNEIKIDLNHDRDDIRKYLNRIHHAGNKLDQRYVMKGLPPLRKS